MLVHFRRSIPLRAEDILLVRIACLLVIALHLLFMLVIDSEWKIDNISNIQDLKMLRSYIWIPSLCIVLAMSLKSTTLPYIALAASIASILHGYGFVYWAYTAEIDGIEYTEMFLVMVTIMTFFAFGIPYFVAFAIVLGYTVLYVVIIMMSIESHRFNQFIFQTAYIMLIKVLWSSVAAAVLISFCAYQSEITKRRLERSRVLIRYGKSTSQEWLQTMARFLRHEIKNKRIAAEQSIFMLHEKESDNGNVDKYCNRASRSLKQMSLLIDQTVQATDVESALLATEWKPVNIKSFLRNYISSFSELVDSDSLQFINQDIFFIPLVYGDEVRLEQMVQKLISNAWDFHTPNTDIFVYLSRERGQININIENEGALLPDDPEIIFEMSYTKRDVNESGDENHGFGLFVARRIAMFHKGSVCARNRDDHKGVIFTVSLPRYKNIDSYAGIDTFADN